MVRGIFGLINFLLTLVLWGTGLVIVAGIYAIAKKDHAGLGDGLTLIFVFIFFTMVYFARRMAKEAKAEQITEMQKQENYKRQLERAQLEKEHAKLEQERAELQQLRRGRLIEFYEDEEIVERIMRHEYWIGQTEDQLRDSMGDPEDIDSTETKRTRKEVWKYEQTRSNSYALKITLSNGVVSKISDRT